MTVLFDKFSPSPPAADTIAPWDTPSLGQHPIDEWLSRQDFAAWRYVPGHGLVGPDATWLSAAWDELPDWDQFVAAVRGDLKRRCRPEQKGRPRRPR